MKTRVRKNKRSVDPVNVPEREAILEFLSATNKPRKLNRIARALNVEDADAVLALEKRLHAMQRDGQIIKNRREGFGLAKKMDLLQGKIIAHPDGYGFMRPDEGGEDLYLSAREMRSLLHGDRVLAHVIDIDRRGRREGALVEILERANKQIVGRYLKDGNIGIVIPDNKRIHQDVLITKSGARKAKSGQYVVARIIQQPDRHTQPIGEISEILGNRMSPDLAVELTVRSFELPHQWSDRVVRESELFTTQVRKEDKKNRRDLKDLPLVTIDGEDARDFDDAVYCEPYRNDWRLLVAIADVSHYVKAGSALDEAARERGNSVYFPRRVIPMLPEILSNELCSLKPDVDRLCIVCELIISKKGKVKNYRFFEGVMRSVARLTYTTVAAILVGRDRVLRKQNNKLLPNLDHLYSLYKIMHKYRESHAVIDFSASEFRFAFDKAGNIESISTYERNDAHRLIEEFMLAANVAAATYLLEHKIPALYRIHETPKQEKLQDLQIFLAELGLSLGGGEQPTARDYAKLLHQIANRDDRHLIETVLLRSMPLAIYSAVNTGHFGLGFPAYTHFTSPIRRYPDLLVHRALRHLLREGTTQKFKYSPSTIQALGTHCSMTERRADEATREIEQWYKCQFMQDKVGEEYTGTISGVTSFGVFVELDDIYVEGLVHITSLPIDYYHFDPVGHRLRGERSGQVYRLANRVRVKVIRVDLEDKKIDFELMV
jgi:ribonuclease R